MTPPKGRIFFYTEVNRLATMMTNLSYCHIANNLTGVENSSCLLFDVERVGPKVVQSDFLLLLNFYSA
jgi:hypothetical protein